MRAAEKMYIAIPERKRRKLLLRRSQKDYLKHNRKKIDPKENILMTLAAMKHNSYMLTRIIQNEHSISRM